MKNLFVAFVKTYKPAIIALAVIAALILVYAVVRSVIDDPKKVAIACAETQVKGYLRSPASAIFDASDVKAREKVPEGDFEVSGSVDSQNGFGALLRNYYTCEITSKYGNCVGSCTLDNQ